MPPTERRGAMYCELSLSSEEAGAEGSRIPTSSSSEAGCEAGSDGTMRPIETSASPPASSSSESTTLTCDEATAGAATWLCESGTTFGGFSMTRTSSSDWSSIMISSIRFPLSFFPLSCSTFFCVLTTISTSVSTFLPPRTRRDVLGLVALVLASGEAAGFDGRGLRDMARVLREGVELWGR